MARRSTTPTEPDGAYAVVRGGCPRVRVQGYRDAEWWPDDPRVTTADEALRSYRTGGRGEWKARTTD